MEMAKSQDNAIAYRHGTACRRALLEKLERLVVRAHEQVETLVCHSLSLSLFAKSISPSFLIS
jgi:ketosteroid isomerase-like protein